MKASFAARSALVTARPTTSLGIANSRFDVISALSLVYEAYLASELVTPNPYEARVTPYHLLPTTEVLTAKCHDNVTCTLTLVRDGKRGLPMEDIFEREVAIRREQGVTCAEVSCLADRRADHERSLPILFDLMSFTAQCAAHRGVQELLVTVHPRHARFYEKFLGFELINDTEQSYDTVCGSPAVALSLDLPRMQMSATRQHKRLFGKRLPVWAFERRPMSAGLLAELREIVYETSTTKELEEIPILSWTSTPQVLPLQTAC